MPTQSVHPAVAGRRAPTAVRQPPLRARNPSCARSHIQALEPGRRRGLQHRRPRVRFLPGVRHRITSPGTSSLTTAEASKFPGPPPRGPGRIGRAVAHRSACASRLTGGAPGSYPGTDWVRDPGRAPRCRSSTGLSASPSSWRMRVRIPSAAPRRRGRMDEAPVYETGRMQVRLLPSTPTRRSSADQSIALRRRRSHVRIVPARRSEQVRPL